MSFLWETMQLLLVISMVGTADFSHKVDSHDRFSYKKKIFKTKFVVYVTERKFVRRPNFEGRLRRSTGTSTDTLNQLESKLYWPKKLWWRHPTLHFIEISSVVPEMEYARGVHTGWTDRHCLPNTARVDVTRTTDARNKTEGCETRVLRRKFGLKGA
jgi:hypothetical protein